MDLPASCPSNSNMGNMAQRTGLEPATPGVTGRYSNRLNYRCASAGLSSEIHKDWWVMTGSNRRPSACKADALPAELITHRLARRAIYAEGFAKSTPCMDFFFGQRFPPRLPPLRCAPAQGGRTRAAQDQLPAFSDTRAVTRPSSVRSSPASSMRTPCPSRTPIQRNRLGKAAG